MVHGRMWAKVRIVVITISRIIIVIIVLIITYIVMILVCGFRV